jgi:4a-hydroxytetrahydrobiopterin dehydratase
VRRQHVVLRLLAPDATMATASDVGFARDLALALAGQGLRLSPGTVGPAPRSVQALEIAVDALEIVAVRPFWKAVLGYVDEPGAGPQDALVDPLGQGPTVWFQQMDAPRPQRNRIHLDISVPPDEAGPRIAATLAAGGRLVDDAEAPAFWVLADAEGNEVCITTWQGRDVAEGS